MWAHQHNSVLWQRERRAKSALVDDAFGCTMLLKGLICISTQRDRQISLREITFHSLISQDQATRVCWLLRYSLIYLSLLIGGILGWPMAQAAPNSVSDNLQGNALDPGYREMYSLDFGGAHAEIAGWIQAHPEDPLGPASDAAAYLFGRRATFCPRSPKSSRETAFIPASETASIRLLKKLRV